MSKTKAKQELVIPGWNIIEGEKVWLFGDVEKWETMPIVPLKPADLSRRWPLDEVARRGGGSINTLEGPRVNLKFSPRAGFIEFEFRGTKFTCHKDELLYFTRFAKGHTAV